MCEVVAVNALDPLSLGWFGSTVQQSALRPSSALNVSLRLFTFTSLLPLLCGDGDVAQCSNISFDLEIFKRVPINPEMQIIHPEDCRGALRSECSFDGVKLKRIIMVFWE